MMQVITVRSDTHQRDLSMTDEPESGSPNDLVAVNFKWPRHVRRAIRQGALDNDTTDSAYVLQALRQTYGIQIDAENLADRRGRPRKDRPESSGKE